MARRPCTFEYVGGFGSLADDMAISQSDAAGLPQRHVDTAALDAAIIAAKDAASEASVPTNSQAGRTAAMRAVEAQKQLMDIIGARTDAQAKVVVSTYLATGLVIEPAAVDKWIVAQKISRLRTPKVPVTPADAVVDSGSSGGGTKAIIWGGGVAAVAAAAFFFLRR